MELVTGLPARRLVYIPFEQFPFVHSHAAWLFKSQQSPFTTINMSTVISDYCHNVAPVHVTQWWFGCSEAKEMVATANAPTKTKTTKVPLLSEDAFSLQGKANISCTNHLWHTRNCTTQAEC